jgi:glycosyltransferase involved in cell wall biosynthesis
MDDLVEHLDTLLSNSQMRNQLGKRGRDKIVNRYDWENRTEDLMWVYKNL